MNRKRKIIIASIFLIAVLIITFSGRKHHTIASVQTFLDKNVYALQQMERIKHQLCVGKDSNASFLIVYTGRAFYTTRPTQEGEYGIVDSFLSEPDANGIRTFMYREDLHIVEIHPDKIRYVFNGSDFVSITDSPATDKGVELRKNTYLHLWSKEDE